MAKLACVVLFMLSLVGCNWILPSNSSDDMKALQGTWTLVSATNNGAPLTADMQWMVGGDSYTVRYNQQTDPTPVKITLSSHNRIDAVHHETPAGTYGGKFKGIYELSGNTLRVCYDLSGTSYPSSFDAGPGSHRVIYVFRRG